MKAMIQKMEKVSAGFSPCTSKAPPGPIAATSTASAAARSHAAATPAATSQPAAKKKYSMDYSRFDALEDSDDEEESASQKSAANRHS